MHREIEDILKNNLLKSFVIKRKIKASDFNKQVYSQNNERKTFSKNMKVDKSKPIITFSDDLEEKIEKANEIDFSENEEIQEKNIEDFNRKIILSVQALNKFIFNDFDGSDLDKAATISIMNLITKMIYNYKNITIEDLKKFRDNNQK